MSEVISIKKARYWREAARSNLLETIHALTVAPTSRDSSQLTIVKEQVHRSILLLDLATQQARVLVGEISDAPRRLNLEAQITTIEQQIQVARQMASNM